MPTLPPSNGAKDARIWEPYLRYPGFGLTCFVCGYSVDEFAHDEKATIMFHHGRTCFLWKNGGTHIAYNV